MRKMFIVAIGLAGLVSFVGTALAEGLETKSYSKAELKEFCDGKSGSYRENELGDYSCTIGNGTVGGPGSVKIGCYTYQGKTTCSIFNETVYNPKRPKHGPADKAPASTLANGSKNSAGASTAGASTLAGNTSPNHAPATNSNGAPSTTRIPAAGSGGGGAPLNGRPRLQQQ